MVASHHLAADDGIALSGTSTLASASSFYSCRHVLCPYICPKASQDRLKLWPACLSPPVHQSPHSASWNNTLDVHLTLWRGWRGGGRLSLIITALPSNTHQVASDLFEEPNHGTQPSSPTTLLSPLLCELIIWNRVCFAPTWLVRKHVAQFQRSVVQRQREPRVCWGTTVGWPG